MFLLLISVAIALGVSALCSLLEATLLSLPESEVAMIASRYPRVGGVWKQFRRRIERPIAVILILNTAAHTVGATVAGARFELLFGEKWLLVFSLVLTYLILQFSEILPKTLGVRYRREIAPFMALPLNAISTCLSPLVWLVHLVNRPFERHRPETDTTLEEVRALVSAARSAQRIDQRQERMITAATRLDNMNVRQLMTPRTEVVRLRLGQPVEEILEIVQGSPYTRLPLYEGDIDHIVGLVHIKDLFKHLELVPGRFDVIPAAEGDDAEVARVVAVPGAELHVLGSGSVNLEKIRREILFMAEETSAHSALRRFQETRQHMAIVVDNHRATQGLVTLEDIIEQLVGDIEDEFDEPAPPLIVEEKGAYRVDGRIRIQELLHRIPGLEISEKGVDTLAGHVARVLGRVPAVGDEFDAGSHRIVVVASDARRAKEIRVIPSPTDAGSLKQSEEE